jgi:hypothetical protein
MIAAEAIVALKEVALTRKYFDAEMKDYVYFSSVAKYIYDYSLITEAERYYMEGKEEVPF